jgi:hypothetical protein
MRAIPIEIGQPFDRLIVIEKDTSKKQLQWLCKCSCGNITSARANSLISGRVRSCGCWRDFQTQKRGKANRRHGMADKVPEYTIWLQMISRCHNPANPAYWKYGGRGIVVCDLWRGYNGFANFYACMGPRPSPLHSLDRYPDNNWNYEPENCRWATRLEQARNTRKTIILTHRGITFPLSRWADILHISKYTLHTRYRQGWATREILFGRPP